MTTTARPPGTRWWRSVRSRVALAVTAVALLVSGVVGWVLAEQSAQAATQAVRDEALSRLAVVSDGYGLDGRLRSGASLNPPSLPPPLAAQLADRRTMSRSTYYDGRLMWAAGRIGPDVVLAVALDASTLDDQDTSRVRALALAGLGALLLSSGLGWAAGTGLTRRLRSAAAAADAIGGGSTTARAAQPGSDEVAVLTRRIDDMADALRRRIAAEQDFTADVAHELRTPLTGLVSAAELLPDGEPTDLVRAQVSRLRRLVEDLLEVSRLDRGAETAEPEPHRLGAAVAASLARVAPTTDAGLDLVVGADDVVLLEPRRLDRILANLATNIARHAEGVGRVVVSGRSVVVTDDGPGYPDDVLAHGPRRFHATGAGKGAGLGLTIVEKQAAVMGARVELGRSPAGGARTEVVFARADR